MRTDDPTNAQIYSDDHPAEQRRRRRGVFYISRSMIDNRIDQIPDVLYRLQFTPMRVEFLLARNALALIGTSPLFDELTDGTHAPEYEIVIDQNDRGYINSVKAVRA